MRRALNCGGDGRKWRAAGTEEQEKVGGGLELQRSQGKKGKQFNGGVRCRVDVGRMCWRHRDWAGERTAGT